MSVGLFANFRLGDLHPKNRLVTPSTQGKLKFCYKTHLDIGKFYQMAYGLLNQKRVITVVNKEPVNWKSITLTQGKV